MSPGPIPNNEQLELFRLGGEWEVLDFIKERHIQKFSHVEDINLGLGVFPSVVWAPGVRSLSSTKSQFLPSLALRKGFRWTASHLLLLHWAYRSSYTDGGNSNRIASVEASYFLRGFPHQTLALRANVAHGWRLDPATPLTLGESNGLRGYGLRQFTGNRRLLFNVEDRIFIRDEVWSLLDVGAAVFYDSGYVWPASNPVRFADLKNSIGVGLRLAPSHSNDNSPVRIDLAYALSDNRSGSRWSLSIMGGLGFGPPLH
jgi:hemolysin activation/secretion protein